MDYVAWCGLVLSELVSLWEQSPRDRQLGVHDRALVDRITPHAPVHEGLASEVGDALHDLCDLGLVVDVHGRFWKVTSSGLSYADDPVPTWQLICSTPLRSDQRELLAVVNRVSQQEGRDLTTVHWIDRDAVESELPSDFDPDMVDPIAEELGKAGHVDRRAFLGGHLELAANLRGLIWETRRDHAFVAAAVEELLEVGETTSVEIKRQLNTKTKSEKAEFVKDILALANTQASGQRLMLIGFDDKTLEYLGPPAPTITQDHLEQILNQYTWPIVQIGYKSVNYRNGVGILEIRRNPAELPYRVAKSVGDTKRIECGQIFVRHGSQVEEPTPVELIAIQEEGERARRKASLED